jgi:hypothetical protein
MRFLRQHHRVNSQLQPEQPHPHRPNKDFNPDNQLPSCQNINPFPLPSLKEL